MGDEIKPVTPVPNMQSKLPPHVPVTARFKPRDPATTRTHAAQSDGYDLSNISSEQAQALLDMPLMQEPRALANQYFSGLKAAIERRAQGTATEQGDLSALITASTRVASLKVETYELPKPGQPAVQPITREMREQINAFEATASSFGQDRPVMRG